MDYNHGYNVMGEPQPPQGPGPGPYQYDAYGNPIGGGGPGPMYEDYNNYGPPSGPPHPGAYGYEHGHGGPPPGHGPGYHHPHPHYSQYVRRDPMDPNVPPIPSSQVVPYPEVSPMSMSMSGMDVERIPRDPRSISASARGEAQAQPHPQPAVAPITSEVYDPSLLTYNATPLYQQPKAPIVARTIDSVFEIAAKKSRFETLVLETPTSTSSHPQSSTEMITGIVTQMRDKFGMVSDEVFFQSTTVMGMMPRVGDKVVVEAERVSGMPFKFNAKKVFIVSKDLTEDKGKQHQPQPVISMAASASTSLEFERRKPDFDPLPTLPSSLNLSVPAPFPSPRTGIKSILKRNPPPPPILSDRTKALAGTSANTASINEAHVTPLTSLFERRRPESPKGFLNGGGKTAFSLDLRGEFPVIKEPPKPTISIQDLYPELLYVRKDDEDKDKKDKKRRSRSSSRERHRSRSRVRDRIRRRSKSPRRGSRSRSRSAERSRRRSRSSSRSRNGRRRSRSPRRGRRSRSSKRRGNRGRPEHPKTSKGRRESGSSDEVQVIEANAKERQQNPFGDDSEIKAVVTTSTLLPTIRRGRGENIRGFAVPNKTGPQPIKFHIGGGPPPPAPNTVIVPNPLAVTPAPGPSLAPAAGPSKPAPNAGTSNTKTNAPKTPATFNKIVVQVEKAMKKKKKKEPEEQQEPAYIVKNKQKPQAAMEGLDVEHIERINALKESLQKQKLVQLKAQEEMLLEQQQELERELQKSTEPKIVVEPPTTLQASFDLREKIEKQRFLDEEHRLKSIGDAIGLGLLYKMEARRERRATEQRLEKLKAEERTLRQQQRWEDLKRFRETFGGTAERDSELSRLKAIRKKEELEEQAEQSQKKTRVLQRDTRVGILDRNQRGTEAPVLRSPRRSSSPRGPVRLHSRDRRRSPPNVRRGRSRSRSRGRRSRSRSRDRVRRYRSPSPRRTRSRSPSQTASRVPRSPPELIPRDVEEERRRRIELELQQREMVAQMERMRRHEEALMMREQGILERMQMMGKPSQGGASGPYNDQQVHYIDRGDPEFY